MAGGHGTRKTRRRSPPASRTIRKIRHRKFRPLKFVLLGTLLMAAICGITWLLLVGDSFGVWEKPVSHVGPWTMVLENYSWRGEELSIEITIRNDYDVPLVFGDFEPSLLPVPAELICKDQYGKIFMELGEQEAMEESMEAFLRGEWQEGEYSSYRREYYPGEEHSFKLRYRCHPLSEDVALYMAKYNLLRQYHLFNLPK